MHCSVSMVPTLLVVVRDQFKPEGITGLPDGDHSFLPAIHSSFTIEKLKPTHNDEQVRFLCLDVDCRVDILCRVRRLSLV